MTATRLTARESVWPRLITIALPIADNPSVTRASRVSETPVWLAPAPPLPVFGTMIKPARGVAVPTTAVGVREPVPAVAVPATAVGVTEPLPAVAVVVAPAVGVPAAAPALLMVTVQVASAPPPFADPLHCLIVGTDAVVLAGVTLHLTRSVPPPPFPELSHCWMVAEVSFGVELGMQTVVGCVPPPCPEPTHWLIVTEAVPGDAPVMITSHVTVAPPPLPEPLHWSIAVTDCVETVGPIHVSAAFANPVQDVTVTVSVAISISTVQCTALPPWLSTPSHCVTVKAARALGVEATASATTPIARMHTAMRRQPAKIATFRAARVN